jgi:hypothetical protein
MPLKAYSWGPVFANPHNRSPKARSPIAERKTAFLPKISDKRPYKTWKTVLAIKLDVPAQAMVVAEWRSAPMVLKAIPIEFWSMKQIRREKARPQKTTISWPFGRILVSTPTKALADISFAIATFTHLEEIRIVIKEVEKERE